MCGDVQGVKIIDNERDDNGKSYELQGAKENGGDALVWDMAEGS